MGCFSRISDWHNYDFHSVQDWQGIKTGSWLFRHAYTSSLIMTAVIGRRHRKFCRPEPSLKTRAWMFKVESGHAVQWEISLVSTQQGCLPRFKVVWREMPCCSVRSSWGCLQQLCIERIPFLPQPRLPQPFWLQLIRLGFLSHSVLMCL